MGSNQQVLSISQVYNNRENFINRELSWLAFNERVLEEAMDDTNPLMERLKFLGITASNLDEFFMVRVANLKVQVKEGYIIPENKAGLTPWQQLQAIDQRTHAMVSRIYEELHSKLIPALNQEGIEFVHPQDLNIEQEEFAHSYFHKRLFPVLTPMAIDSSRPFPMLINRSLNLAVHLRKQVNGRHTDLFAVVPVPALFPRYIELPAEEHKHQYILLEQIICNYMTNLFPGNTIISVHPFRITIEASLPLKEDVDDLLEEIEKELKKRKLGSAVRLEVDERMNDVVKEFLRESLECEDGDIYTVKGPLDLTFLIQFALKPGFEHLLNEPLYPQPPQELIGESNNIFDAILKKDILLHHPYESFDPVVHFICTAAEDPEVLAIKQTLYRVGVNSPIVEALAKAAENGKQVMVLVELKARFDEENNIVWAKKLEESGCHVIYGLVGLKTHCKITMVVRKVGDVIKRFVHLGTGNYNAGTAKLYTDLGLLTSREDIGEDATIFFNHLTGYASTPSLKQLAISPNGIQQRLLALIENEIRCSTVDKPGYIIAKMNSLTDKEMIQALFAASASGVKIDLIIRGICCLKPGIPGISENIRVFSIIDRFLEHSRIYYFQNGGNEQLFLSSADWMTRNLKNRVEILFPIQTSKHKERIKGILSACLHDNVKARQLMSDGQYVRVVNEEPPLRSQLFLHELASSRIHRC
ncbi:MAG TPA: RNA degradosome polyphosphate kinase [Bacillota bacterium]|nr:RNA degradosome polyphosphate kinase [Bacillota bacterium]